MKYWRYVFFNQSAFTLMYD